jgi:CHRD domain
MAMRRRLIAVLVSSVVLAGGVVSAAGAPAGADDPPHAPAFAAGVVRLDGAQEAPTPGDDDGRGTFAYVAVPDKLCYLLTARRIEPATLAHIHAGPRGVAGPIVVMLVAPTNGFSAGCIQVQPDTVPNTMDVLTQSEVNAIIATPAQFYANVHNAPFPAGAIRGQLR